jgi:hypothetical protein
MLRDLIKLACLCYEASVCGEEGREGEGGMNGECQGWEEEERRE